ncbi:MAG: hypothetical protein ACD_84C00031G0004 [uncultured bacterium]|nr:MAG: hypothetical protein ACD_84C00031G0004 [uncultured bacterium]
MRLLRRILNVAMEDSIAEDQTVVMKGPLSEVFTQALDIAYAKETPADIDTDEPQTVAVLESQQMDVAVMRKLTEAMRNTDAENVQTVYAVSKDAVEEQTIVDVSSELVNKPEGNDFVLIVDAVGSGAIDPINQPTMRTVELTNALECLVTAHGGKIFTSLEAYAASYR